MYKINSGYVALLVNTLWEEGLDVPELCRKAGLDMALLAHPETYVERSVIYRLLALAADWSGNPDIGLKVYNNFHSGRAISSFKLVGYTMMSSSNLRQALDRLVRFSPLIGSGFSLFFSESDSGQYRLNAVELQEFGSTCPRQFIDASLAALYGFCRWLTGGKLPQPMGMEFAYPRPNDIRFHQRVFGCPLHFDTAQASILFDRQSLMQPLITANEALSELHESFAEAQLGLLGDSYTTRVRTLIIGGLQQRKFNIDSVAAELCISKRTLQRELEKEGVQFKDILDGVRRKMAVFYLQHARYGLKQTAYLLGFQDLSSFHKACLRWFDMTPGQIQGLDRRLGNTE